MRRHAEDFIRTCSDFIVATPQFHFFYISPILYYNELNKLQKSSPFPTGLSTLGHIQNGDKNRLENKISAICKVLLRNCKVDVVAF